MDKLKILVTVLAVSFGISVLGGMFEWYFADGFTILLGLIDIVCVAWLLVLAYKK